VLFQIFGTIVAHKKLAKITCIEKFSSKFRTGKFSILEGSIHNKNIKKTILIYSHSREESFGLTLVVFKFNK